MKKYLTNEMTKENILKSLFSRSDYVRIKDMCELKTISEA